MWRRGRRREAAGGEGQLQFVLDFGVENGNASFVGGFGGVQLVDFGISLFDEVRDVFVGIKMSKSFCSKSLPFSSSERSKSLHCSKCFSVSGGREMRW